MLEPRLGFAVPANRGAVVVPRRHRLLEASQLLLQGNQVARAGEDVFAQGQTPLEWRPLIVQGDTRPFLERQVAALETRLAYERSEQGRLAGAVWPRERDAVAALDLEGHSVEQRVAGKLLAEVGCDHDGHRYRLDAKPHILV